MSLIVTDWERARADEIADRAKEANTSGVTGADDLAQTLPPGMTWPATADAEIRRLSYALLGSLAITPEWIEVTSFENNWASLGGALSHNPAFMIDPFGFVHWRGLVGRTSGAAVNGETICNFPAKFMPAKLLGFPCITNSGLIHIGVFNDGADGGGRLTWRTTGGFTGGYSFVYLDNIGVYDTRG